MKAKGTTRKRRATKPRARTHYATRERVRWVDAGYIGIDRRNNVVVSEGDTMDGVKRALVRYVKKHPTRKIGSTVRGFKIKSRKVTKHRVRVTVRK